MINIKYSKALELNSVLEELSQKAISGEAVRRIMNIKPNTNFAFVQDELSKTDEAYKLITSFGEPNFIKIEDPTEQLSLAKAGGVLSAHSLLNIGRVLRQARMLHEWIAQCGEYIYLKPVFALIEVNRQLEKRISEVILSEDEIADTASDELYAIRRKIRTLSSKIKDDLDKMVRSSTYKNALQDNIVTMRDGRYVLPVKAEHKGVVNGLVHDTSSSGATLFVEPIAVVEANNDIRVAQAKEKAEIERILGELSAVAAESAEIILDDFNVSVTLDIYFAKAKLAVQMRATRPNLCENGKIELKKARHPLIHKDQVVPIDVSIGEGYRSLVITGPNTGGKTVTLKTIGLLTLMTMCGMMIPAADNSTVSVFENILVDIGDEQSIAQNLSTFSAHMTNIVSILNTANSKSLVLVDELGSGTDPVEGAALAEAILEKLKSIHAIVAATTHYAELKVYALETEGVMNASCEFDVKTLRPTYRLLIGTPGRSNAFEISRRLGVSDEILSAAATLVSGEQKRFENVIDSLEEARQAHEKSERELRQARAELDSLQAELRDTNAAALRQKEEIIEQAHKKAQDIVDKVKLDSAYLMEELDKLRREKDKEDFSRRAAEAKATMRGKIDKLHNEANPVTGRTNEGYVLPRKLKKGDCVLLVDIDKTGYLLEEPGNSNTVLVQTGIMKTRVPISNLRLVEENKKQQKRQGSSTRTVQNKAAKASMELDLRGMTVEEAIMELDMFISRSILSNIGIVTIIHGKGTGALRAAVHQHLKSCKQIKSYRLGVYGEGEAGVTIAEFK